jgi:thiamine biosynthesis lipoprotein
MSAVAAGVLRVEHIMGTVIGIDVRDHRVPAAALDDAFDVLRRADAQFSPFRTDSEVSRLARGELTAADCSLELRQILALAEQLREESGGAFDVRGPGARNGFDPSGIVKGWAVEAAAWILDDAGARNYAVNAGGDVIVRGEPEPGEPWRIGVRHPTDARAVARVLELRGGAVATSGTYERGDHIWRQGDEATDAWLSLTVVGPSLTFADAYATAGFAMGRHGLAWVERHAGYRAYGIVAEQTGELRWVEGAGPAQRP